MAPALHKPKHPYSAPIRPRAPPRPLLQALDWVDVCSRCEEVQVAAHMVLLGVGQEPMGQLVREVGLNSLQVRLLFRAARGWQGHWSSASRQPQAPLPFLLLLADALPPSTLQQHLYKRVGAAMAEGEHFMEVGGWR